MRKWISYLPATLLIISIILTILKYNHIITWSLVTITSPIWGMGVIIIFKYLLTLFVRPKKF
jgi:hypothetical protein